MLFSSDAGSWAETMPSSECVSCVCVLRVSGSVRFIAYGGMKSLQSQKAHGAPLYSTESSSVFYPQPFHRLHPVWCVCQHYGCMHV